MSDLWQAYLKMVIVVLLNVGLLLLAVYLVERSLVGALKAVKMALKSEFTTDVGRINLIGMIFFILIYFFSSLHEMAGRALSTDQPARNDVHVLGPLALFCLGFVGSMICVLLMERKLGAKEGRETNKRDGMGPPA